MQIVSQENKLRAAGHSRGLARAGRQPTAGSSGAHADRFLQLKPGQHVTVELPLDSHTSGRQAEASCGARSRFSAAVVDLEGQAAAKAATECAVFLVPQVRLWKHAKGTAFWADAALVYYPCLSTNGTAQQKATDPPPMARRLINETELVNLCWTH